MDRSFEVYSGHALNDYTRDSTRARIDWLCENASGNILDLGCSQGLTAWLLGHKGLKVTGIDKDPDAITWAKNKLSEADETARANITLNCEDFLNFNPDEKFDTIIAGEYLEHLPEAALEAHLAHAAALLKPKGKLLITPPFGLHNHPDHEQIFFPLNLSQKLNKYFNIEFMDCKDAWLRCICNLAEPHAMPDLARLIELTEQGAIQLTEKANAGKRATKIKKLAQISQDKDIEAYLGVKTIPAVANDLQKKLAARGLFAPFVYDRYLFETLNDLYQDKPLVPQPRAINPASLFTQADKRIDYLQKHFDLANKKCLEIGCGGGETAVRLSERLNSDVTGVDVREWPEWEERRSKNTHLEAIDLTESLFFEPESFDFIYSFAVLEHVQKPLAMLEAMYSLLKPSGQIYFTANLYRGPQASHRYREVFFPWPHLLFEDDVFKSFYAKLDGRKGVTPFWVNKLTHLHYLDKIRELGFTIKRCSYSTTPLDRDFYECFEDKLGRYPEADLEKNFINMMLVKPVASRDL